MLLPPIRHRPALQRRPRQPRARRRAAGGTRLQPPSCSLRKWPFAEGRRLLLSSSTVLRCCRCTCGRPSAGRVHVRFTFPLLFFALTGGCFASVRNTCTPRRYLLMRSCRDLEHFAFVNAYLAVNMPQFPTLVMLTGKNESFTFTYHTSSGPSQI